VKQPLFGDQPSRCAAVLAEPQKPASLTNRLSRDRLPGMSKTVVDPAILKAKKLFQASGKSLDELGRDLGLTGATAKKGAWQLLNRVADPKIGTLRLLAKALGISIEELVSERRKA
jgi:hypothetical protein